jgi:hypothetical protein
MNHIPKVINDDMNTDPFYRKCCLARFGGCGGINIYGRTIERHHNLIYAGKQVQKKCFILPSCPNHHSLARNKDVQEKFDWVMLNRATDQELIDVSKSIDYIWERNRLNNIYGQYDK